jgi:hypothetical protein
MNAKFDPFLAIDDDRRATAPKGLILGLRPERPCHGSQRFGCRAVLVYTCAGGFALAFPLVGHKLRVQLSDPEMR